MTIPRQLQKRQDTWDLSPLYPSLEDWSTELSNESSIDYAARTQSYQETTSLTADQVKSLLDLYYATDRRLKKLYTWAHLFHDQDTANDAGKQALQTILNRYHSFLEAFSWMEPKILSHTEEQLASFLSAAPLKEYLTILERLFRLKKHTLPSEQEAILAMAGRALDASSKSFSALNDADLRFGSIPNSAGEVLPLTHASYGVFLRSPDRTLRKNAFEALHQVYRSHENTLSELLRGEIQRHQFEAKARSYTSCLEAALFPNNIPTPVYHNLITTVRNNVHILHRYVALKKRTLGYEALYPWDLYVPLTPNEDRSTFSYHQATELVGAAVSPLGTAYVNRVRDGITTQRWVDRFENINKHSGAYSSGCYDSPPYILMNYKDQLRDVFTLAHEVGHSMHSDLSRHQPYHYSNYSIFVAEVASTFNEELLSLELLRQNTSSPQLQAAILNEKIEDFRGTLFRQTLFAEFELFLHGRVERGEPITPTILSEKYLELNRFYYGPELELSPLSAIEWARIPHFYYNFYVYQYATGICAAMALANRVTHGGAAEQQQYLSFLRGGNSLFPIELLRTAGVDMASPLPIEQALHRCEEVIGELEALVKVGN